MEAKIRAFLDDDAKREGCDVDAILARIADLRTGDRRVDRKILGRIEEALYQRFRAASES